MNYRFQVSGVLFYNWDEKQSSHSHEAHSWFLLLVPFKISDEHHRSFYIGSLSTGILFSCKACFLSTETCPMHVWYNIRDFFYRGWEGEGRGVEGSKREGSSLDYDQN